MFATQKISKKLLPFPPVLPQKNLPFPPVSPPKNPPFPPVLPLKHATAFRLSKTAKFSTPKLPQKSARTDAAETAIDAARDFLAAAKEQVRVLQANGKGRDVGGIYSLQVKIVYNIIVYQYSHIPYQLMLYIYIILLVCHHCQQVKQQIVVLKRISPQNCWLYIPWKSLLPF